MNKPITKLAAATVIIIAVIFGALSLLFGLDVTTRNILLNMVGIRRKSSEDLK